MLLGDFRTACADRLPERKEDDHEVVELPRHRDDARHQVDWRNRVDPANRDRRFDASGDAIISDEIRPEKRVSWQAPHGGPEAVQRRTTGGTRHFDDDRSVVFAGALKGISQLPVWI